jgi:alpha-galactosidase
MTKITLIGAGSLVFTRSLCNDILLTPALQDSTISIMDIDPRRLEQGRALVQALIERRGLPTRLEATLDRRKAVRGADYVITTFQQGGLDAYRMDIEIPRKYGVEQCVGDTLGPGGVFRGLRTIPVLLDLCEDLDEVASDALLINYTNPMAINSWATIESSGRPYVGLCHSVQGTSEMLAKWIDIPLEQINYLCAGINHQSFFLEFQRGKEDLYPLIWDAIGRREIYAREPVRIDMMRHFGHFVTESSGHASEYVPYYRKTAAAIEKDLVSRFKDPCSSWFDFGRTGGYLKYCLEREKLAQQDFKDLIAGVKDLPPTRSNEYGSRIIEAMETNQPISINGNVLNFGLIDNLPEGCCVEVPCLVNGSGIQPTAVGALPNALAALNRTNINVQQLAVDAAMNEDIEAVYHAVMLDPLTSAVCTLDQVHEMVDEMLAAESQWLPQFD